MFVKIISRKNILCDSEGVGSFEFEWFPMCTRRENPSPRMKCQEIGVSSNLKNLRRIELEDWQQQRLQQCIMGKRGSKHFLEEFFLNRALEQFLEF